MGDREWRKSEGRAAPKERPQFGMSVSLWRLEHRHLSLTEHRHFAPTATADVEVLTVETSDAPGSLTVKVRPDQDGIAASVALVRWAEPELVLLEPPQEVSNDFVVTLVGDREVGIVCGPPISPKMYTPSRDIDPATRDRIDEGLIDVVDMIESREPQWEPLAHENAIQHIVDRYMDQDTSDVPASTVRSVLVRGQARVRLEALLKERRIQHRNAWARNAQTIANELLAGPDGQTLRESGKPARIGLILGDLQRRDPYCATRGAIEPIADAIGRIVGPRKRS